MILKPVRILKSCFCCVHNDAIDAEFIKCIKHDIFECDWSFTRTCDDWVTDGRFDLRTPFEICCECKHLVHDQREGYCCIGATKEFRATCGGNPN